MVEIFSNFVFLVMGTLMHTEYIVLEIPCALLDQGSPFEGHLHAVQFYFILCFEFYTWTVIYMMFSKCKFHI